VNDIMLEHDVFARGERAGLRFAIREWAKSHVRGNLAVMLFTATYVREAFAELRGPGVARAVP
jgi:hypothetical protein